MYHVNNVFNYNLSISLLINNDTQHILYIIKKLYKWIKYFNNIKNFIDCVNCGQ